MRCVTLTFPREKRRNGTRNHSFVFMVDEILRFFELNRGRDVPNHGLFRFQDLPFQTVFFTSGKQVARTSVQIVSYIRNGEMVYVNTPDPKS